MTRGEIVPLVRVEGRTEEISDTALVAACRVGDAAALGALFDRLHGRVVRFLGRISAAQGADVEDLLQETFWQVWRSAGRYRGDAPVTSWVLGIAANVARHHVRSEVRRRRTLTLLAEAPEPVSATDTEATVERAERWRRLDQALDNLTHDQRTAFVMCDLEGIKGTEAARTLGVRPGTMWRRLHDARRHLREALREPGGDTE